MRYIDLRDWKEVIWAITTRVDPLRDTTLVDRTPIDYLRLCLADREWGSPIAMSKKVTTRVDSLWGELGIG
jgi:4-hydroxy-3-polyprenylbenzoate decarboxylase